MVTCNKKGSMQKNPPQYLGRKYCTRLYYIDFSLVIGLNVALFSRCAALTAFCFFYVIRRKKSNEIDCFLRTV